eukprot:c13016_g1_i1 orf=232-495(-)
MICLFSSCMDGRDKWWALSEILCISLNMVAVQIQFSVHLVKLAFTVVNFVHNGCIQCLQSPSRREFIASYSLAHSLSALPLSHWMGA